MQLTRQIYFGATLASLAACSASTEPAPGGGQPAPTGGQPAPVTTLPRTLTAAETKLVTSTNDFSFALLKQLSAAKKDSNVFTSPLSGSMSLGMAMAGASGNTYEQMRTTLGFGTTPDTDVNASYKSVIELLRGLDPTVDFRIANSVWYRNGFAFNQSFLDVTRTYFDAKVSALDFNSSSAVPTINDWVNTSTNGKISNIIEKIESDHVMFLINAIYFKGSWRDKFDVAQTYDAPFHAATGDQPAKLMHRSAKMSYLGTSDFDAVDLPYGNAAFAMTVVLPKSGKSIDAVTASLSSTAWSGWTSQMRESYVDLSLPRLKLTWEKVLNADLIALGMRDAFDGTAANFSRMASGGPRLVISEVKQKTYVDVNEEGTEAAAVTSTGVVTVSAPVYVSMKVDRPYIFVIRERLSGTVVFMGKIVRMP